MQAWQVQSRVPEVTSSLPGHMFEQALPAISRSSACSICCCHISRFLQLLQLHMSEELAVCFQVHQPQETGSSGSQSSWALGCQKGEEWSRRGAGRSRGRTHAEEVHAAVINTRRQAEGRRQMERPGTVSRSVTSFPATEGLLGVCHHRVASNQHNTSHLTVICINPWQMIQG